MSLVRASLLAHDVLGALRALGGPRECDEEDGVCGEDADVEEELEEVLLVPLADTVVDPGAVVVHLLDAAAALPAVVRARNLKPAANLQCTGFLSEIGTKLRDWAVGQAGGCCYSRAALSSNDSETLYCLRFPPDMIEVRQLDFLHCRVHRHTSHHCRHRSSSFFSGLQPSGTYPGPSSAADRKW